MLAIDQILIVVSLLLLLGILASKLSSRLGIPSLLLFLLIGMLAGSEGLGGIPFDDARVAQFLGVVALALILFAGGFETDWAATSSVFWKGLSLSTIGVLCTAVLVGLFVAATLEVSTVEGLLLGSIVASTDAAAVFAVLRSRGVGLKGRNRPLLEFESGSNDPMAVLLTVGFIRLLTDPAMTPLDLVPIFLLQLAVGGAVGYASGKLSLLLLNRVRLETEGLYPVMTLAICLGTYSVASLLQGSGFLAVFLTGIVLGNGDLVHKRSLIRFHDGVAWLMQITMFLTLGLLVYPSRLLPIADVGLLISVFLMFVARPVSVFVSLLASKTTVRNKILISWVGLRGATPIILATFPLIAGIKQAELYFNIVFFIVITSVLLQGTTLNWIAKKLRLQAPISARSEYPLEFVPTKRTRSDLVEVPIPPDSPAAHRQVVELRLPKSALIVLISRNENILIPRGATVLEPGDRLLVLADKEDLDKVRRILNPGPSPPEGSEEGAD